MNHVRNSRLPTWSPSFSLTPWIVERCHRLNVACFHFHSVDLYSQVYFHGRHPLNQLLRSWWSWQTWRTNIRQCPWELKRTGGWCRVPIVSAQKGCRHDILRSTAASCLIPVRSSLIIKLQSLLRTEAITIWSCLDGCYHGSLPSIAHDTSAAAIFIPNDSFLQQRRVSGGKMCVFSFNNRPRVTWGLCLFAFRHYLAPHHTY